MSGSIITAKGRALIGKLLSSQGALAITKAAVGSGTVPAGSSADDLTELVHYIMGANIIGVGSPAQGEAKVDFEITSSGVISSFLLSEAAIYATDPDDGEILYCYVDLSSDPIQVSAPEAGAIGKLITLSVSMIISNVESITAQISPNSLVRRTELEYYAKKVHSHEISDINGLQAALDSIGDLTASDIGAVSEDTYNQFYEIVSAHLSSTSRAYVQISAVSGSIVLDAEEGNVGIMTASGATSFTLSNFPSTTEEVIYTLYLTVATGASFIWDSTYRFANGEIPTLEEGGAYCLLFWSDGGSGWIVGAIPYGGAA